MQTLEYFISDLSKDQGIKEIVENEVICEINKIFEQKSKIIQYTYNKEKTGIVVKDEELNIKKNDENLIKIISKYKEYEEELKIKFGKIKIKEAITESYVQKEIYENLYKIFQLFPENLIKLILIYHCDIDVIYHYTAHKGLKSINIGNIKNLYLSTRFTIKTQKLNAIMAYHIKTLIYESNGVIACALKINSSDNDNLLKTFNKLNMNNKSLSLRCQYISVAKLDTLYSLIDDLENFNTHKLSTVKETYFIINGEALNNNIYWKVVRNQLKVWNESINLRNQERENRYNIMKMTIYYGSRNIYYIFTIFSGKLYLVQIEINRKNELVQELKEIYMIAKYVSKSVTNSNQIVQ